MSISPPLPQQRKIANLSPISPTMLEAAQRHKFYIFSVNPKPFQVTLDRIYTIPARKPGLEVSEPLVIDGLIFQTDVAYAEGFHTEWKWTTIEGMDMVMDIMGTAMGKDPSNDLTRYGVFFSRTAVPLPEEIDAAKAKLNDYYGRIIQAADRAYEINGGQELVNGVAYSNIGETAVEAANAMGLDKPWKRKPARAMIPCPACDEPVRPNAAICGKCDAILDEEKARKFFPHKFQEEKRGPGRPKAVAE